MALNSNYISFLPLVEAVYRRAGYQSVDWAEAIEIIGETIRLIGALPAYRNVTTNGDSTNPLEVTDFRAQIPTDFVILEAIRKVNIEEDSDGALTISSFSPMIESTDLFYKSIRNNWDSTIGAGTYDYNEFKQVNIVTLSGTSGTATIGGPLSKTATFSISLTTTASNFVTTYAADYLTNNIVITSDGATITFKATDPNVEFSEVTVTNASGDLTGTVSTQTDVEQVIVQSPVYKRPSEYVYQYKLDNGYIITNFETGYIELSYKAFVVDDHGFPMIPDDQRYMEAIRWSVIENLDYKKWRVAEISDKVYAKSEANRDWYIASARSKADIPSAAKMESLKNMFLRSITKVNSADDYFKYSNIPEQRR